MLDFFTFTAEKDVVVDLEGSGPADEETGGFATFSTDAARSISETMRLLPNIGPEDAQRWVKYWKTVGFIEGCSESDL